VRPWCAICATPRLISARFSPRYGIRITNVVDQPYNTISFQVDVNGDNAAPLYKYLKAKQTGTLGSGLKWNFTKFLVNKEGIPINRYAPTTDPMDIAKDIEKLL